MTTTTTTPSPIVATCQTALNTTSAEWVDRLYHGVFQVAFPVLITLGLVTNLTNLAVLTRPAMRNKTYR